MMANEVVAVVNQEPEDPPYIVSLLSRNVDHDCYMNVGNPLHETPERIGVLSAMLMAHSLVLRRLMSEQQTDLDERWDIPIPFIRPHTFKNLLKFVYGFNHISSLSVQDAVELMNAAVRLTVEQLFIVVEQHLINKLAPGNVCIILQEATFLKGTKLKAKIAKVITNNVDAILESDKLHLISPDNMRFIFLLETLNISKIYLWQTVVRWARTKVLCGEEEIESLPISLHIKKCYLRPRLIPPLLADIEDCALHLIELVQLALSKDTIANEAKNIISKYHMVPSEPPHLMLMCKLCDKKSKTKHNEFYAKIIYNSKLWADPLFAKNSELFINTVEKPVQLIGIVCTGGALYCKNSNECYKNPTKKDVHSCEVSCEIKIYCIQFIKKKKCSDLKTIINFKQEIMHNEEFIISLENNSGGYLKMLPDKMYRIETKFSDPHPLWYSNPIETLRATHSTDVDVIPGLANVKEKLHSSHITNVIYKFV